ncbi:hypothetical protein BKE30_06415 [Alkanindiges hydrocarboniclasticus]|jgi:uncharacterized protein YggL (DUF469 family)|uniref:DUF4259 domain-containing protein n=1 Tax=Alkanindiges hydrocarboniclasticus TaxID=1907941 RepID=A0A1S8CVS0_9GAMM|nr:DUF4259 domain-containing protein [Alkanindiges hydrocarboniclasticus]ONG41054.1 hypothetical protein BKE30_06415 [Alkanindiges hydrocarboniclasticus]
MGAWGTGIFEDDTALDAMEEAMDSTVQDFLQQVLMTADDEEYLEYDRAHQIIIAGVILDYLLNGTVYEQNDETFAQWLDQQSRDSVDQFKPAVLAGLKVVLSDQSELNELWQENSMEYPNWRANVEGMIARLED